MSIDHESMKKNLEERLNTIQLPSSKPDPFETLSKTESGVLELLTRGYSDQEIADVWYISKHTVRSHKKEIYSKVGASKEEDIAKGVKTTILYMISHPKPFLESYTKEELEKVKLIDNLTPRELNVLEYYILGFSYKKIADKLRISKNTVKRHHLFNTFYKLYPKERDGHKKHVKVLRLYILRYPEKISSLYSQVKHIIANSGRRHFKKEIDIEPISSNITPNQNLTPREFEILNELIKGGSNEEIAHSLFINKTTLRRHIMNINKKWNIKGRRGGHRSETILAARRQIYANALEMYSNQSVTSSER